MYKKKWRILVKQNSGPKKHGPAVPYRTTVWARSVEKVKLEG
jgi:hypothetical protein